MSVLAILVLMLTTIFDQASRAWANSEGNAERRRNSRALADYIAGELRAALVPVDQRSQLNGNLRFLINPPSGYEEYRYADAIFWHAPLATETTYGDVASVGYFVRWDEKSEQDDGGLEPPRPVLARYFVNPSIVSSGGTVKPNPDFKIFTEPDNWVSASMIELIAPAVKGRRNDPPANRYRGLFADNVLGLWARSYRLDGTELPRTFDSRDGYKAIFNSTNTQGFNQQWPEQRYLPARVQISLLQIDSKTANRLEPIVDLLKSVTKDTSILDAAQCLENLRAQSEFNPSLRSLVKGLRVYTADVQLENAR